MLPGALAELVDCEVIESGIAGVVAGRGVAGRGGVSELPPGESCLLSSDALRSLSVKLGVSWMVSALILRPPPGGDPASGVIGSV